MDNGKYYDITFHILNDGSFTKKQVYSSLDSFSAWEDACSKITEKHLYIFYENRYITIDRKFIVRVEAKEVKSSFEKEQVAKEGISKVVDTLNGLGL